jgi:hypothetical protein
MTKAELVQSQIKHRKILMTQWDKYIESDQFNDQNEEDEEIITLTEEVYDEENPNRSRHAE